MPATKPPKITNTPSRNVMSPETKMTMMMMAIRSWGKWSFEGFIASMTRFSSGRNRKWQVARYTASNAICVVKPVTENCAVVNALTTASSVQPVTSSIAAAVMAMAPSRVRVMPSSIMMRPRIGIAVIDSATARNSR